MNMHNGLKESGRWNKFSFIEQMANIASEIGRTINRKRAGENLASQAAFFRALELIDLTVDDKKNRGSRRLREVLRTREALVDHFMCDNIYQTTDEQWDKYFMGFAWLSAIQRGR